MKEEPFFHTETMAKVLADQGHWSQAAAIYRHLLKKEPDRKDLAQALAVSERQCRNSEARHWSGSLKSGST